MNFMSFDYERRPAVVKVARPHAFESHGYPAEVRVILPAGGALTFDSVDEARKLATDLLAACGEADRMQAEFDAGKAAPHAA